jgi:hypothetical protein
MTNKASKNNKKLVCTWRCRTFENISMAVYISSRGSPKTAPCEDTEVDLWQMHQRDMELVLSLPSRGQLSN